MERIELIAPYAAKRYFRYFNNSRPHQSLDQDSPIPRIVESGRKGQIVSIPEVGGLHHLYHRAAWYIWRRAGSDYGPTAKPIARI